MNFKKWWKKLEYWKRGCLIGGGVGLLMLVIVSTPINGIQLFNEMYTAINFVPLEFAHFISFRSNWGEAQMVVELLLAIPFLMVYYALAGSIIGLVYGIIKHEKKK